MSIEIKDLTKKFKNRIAVDKLTLSIKKGELFSLLGMNGAGKTTTIRMLSCLITPTSGDALLMGKSILLNTNEVKSISNFSPQETAVAMNLNVKENLEFMARIYGIDKKQAKIKAQKKLDEFKLNEVKKDKAKTLSGGMQRRLSIAMALISDPKILFLDEPTLGLDVLSRRELWELINNLKNKMTIILTTHYMEEAESLSDRIGIMSKGVLKEIGTAKELIEKTGTDKFENAFIKIATGSEVLV
ncbi:ABC transporter ATP-binding protein [Oceanotoga teriensis]|jgi:ABC-2 type transport system ATP-binding protein|uniref:ABC transporter ATP-binding protein n=1 Tax=Oceanotoga teriensis TaxID=515440 RepID=UPI0027129020|nr:ABC transporter ATP-binding protein [Oceanotoga teriensis]MDO7976380.1 ABC transporter ATP-binding protein [Oceanotoga teriensis]